MRNEFSTFDIVKALGIPRERLKDWMNNGFIKPATPAEGKGTKAVFTRSDIYLVALFQDLIDKNFKRSAAAFIVKYLRKKYSDLKNVSNIYIILAGGGFTPVDVIVFDKKHTRTPLIDLDWGIPISESMNSSEPIDKKDFEKIARKAASEFKNPALENLPKVMMSMPDITTKGDVQKFLYFALGLVEKISELEKIFPEVYEKNAIRKIIGKNNWEEIIIVNFLRLKTITDDALLVLD